MTPGIPDPPLSVKLQSIVDQSVKEFTSKWGWILNGKHVMDYRSEIERVVRIAHLVGLEEAQRG